MNTKALALLAGVALSATAFADEAVVVAPVADQAVVVETAKLDTDVVLSAADAVGGPEEEPSVPDHGMPPGVIIGATFATASIVVFTVLTDGNPLGVSPGHQ